MQQQLFCKELGATAACTRRLCQTALYSGTKCASRRDAKADGSPEAFLGDSWFTGVKVTEWAAEHGHSYFGALKTSTKFTPFEELTTKMSDWPSGSYLVLECTTPKGHDLICIGYKYSASKVLVFLGTKNSGSTKPGDPYVARFPDANGNVAQRNVQRPAVISEYFKDSNVIDSHNQARQYELALEKRWITKDCYFRVNTTLLGMTVTDCWRAYKQGMPAKKNKKTEGDTITIKDFADRMAYDCIHNTYSDVASFNGYIPAIIEDEEAALPRMVGGRQSDVSNVTEPTLRRPIADIALEHPFRDNPELERDKGDGTKPRPIRRVCKAERCKKTYHKQCFNRECLDHRYMSSKGWVYGVFYCQQHMYLHYEAVQSGTGV